MLVLNDLTAGGVERGLINLLNNWPAKFRAKWKLTLVVRSLSGELSNEIPSWIDSVSLNVPIEGAWSFFAVIWKLGMLVKHRRPQAIFVYHTATFVPAVLATRLASRSTKTIVAVNAPLSLKVGGVRARMLFSLACKATDRFLEAWPAEADDLHTVLRVPRRKIFLLPPNKVPVDLDLVRANKDMRANHSPFERKDIPIIITAGRLSYGKRLDILLRAAQLLASRITFNLVIVGDGPLREGLQQLASSLGIRQRTFFLGFQTNPWKFIARAAVFVISSDVEGGPMVLVEAMACGVPVVATRAPFGPEHIISNGESGLLVPTRDPPALANAIWRLLVDGDLRRRCIEGGLKRAAEFKIEKIAESYCSAIEGLINSDNEG